MWRLYLAGMFWKTSQRYKQKPRGGGGRLLVRGAKPGKLQKYFLGITHIWGASRDNLYSGLLTVSTTNRTAQAQKLAKRFEISGARKWRDCTIYEAKAKKLISYAVIAQLIHAFVFLIYAKSSFYDAPHFSQDFQKLPVRLYLHVAHLVT